MTNPTSNFGWQMPESTDLVTNLPADFEVFGQAVDTDFADLLGGTAGQVLSKTSGTDLDFTWIANDQGDITGVTAGTGISGGGTSGTVTVTNDMATTITAAGDIVVGTGSGTYDNLPIGTTAQVLTADTTVSPYKVKWATASAGGMTQIATGTMSGSTFSLSSFSGYNNLQIVLRNYYGSAGGTLRMRLNNDATTTKYYYGVNTNAQDNQSGVNFNNLAVDGVGTNAGLNNALINIYDYAQSSGFKLYDAIGSFETASGTQTPIFTLNGVYESISTLTSVDFVFTGGGTFSGGTYILYGVK